MGRRAIILAITSRSDSESLSLVSEGEEWSGMTAHLRLGIQPDIILIGYYQISILIGY